MKNKTVSLVNAIICSILIGNQLSFAESYREKAAEDVRKEYADSIKDLEEKVAAVQKTVEEKTRVVDELEKEMASEKGSLAKAREALRATQADSTKAQAAVRANATNPEALRLLANDIENARKRASAAEVTIREAEAKVRDLDSKLKKQKAEVETAKAQVSRRTGLWGKEGLEIDLEKERKAQDAAVRSLQTGLDSLEASIRQAHVTAKLQDLKGDIKDEQLKLAALENAYNQGLIGNFVRAKLEGLLGDPAFCQSTKSCESGSKNKTDLKHLFETTARDRAKDQESHK